jgi:hypothetical protein
MGGPRQKATLYRPGKEASPETNQHLDLELTVYRNVRKKFLLFKPSCQCYFVILTLAE